MAAGLSWKARRNGKKLVVSNRRSQSARRRASHPRHRRIDFARPGWGDGDQSIAASGTMSQFARRNFLQLAAATAAVSALPRHAVALDYPNHAVRLVIGFPPGGPTDIYGRLIGQWLSQRLGQPFVVENRPGAGSAIGGSEGVHSAPDGYTILLVSTSAAISSSFSPNLDL